MGIFFFRMKSVANRSQKKISNSEIVFKYCKYFFLIDFLNENNSYFVEGKISQCSESPLFIDVSWVWLDFFRRKSVSDFGEKVKFIRSNISKTLKTAAFFGRKSGLKYWFSEGGTDFWHFDITVVNLVSKMKGSVNPFLLLNCLRICTNKLFLLKNIRWKELRLSFNKISLLLRFQQQP